MYATDRDAGQNGEVMYSIAEDSSGGFFRIESRSGWIKVARAMSGVSTRLNILPILKTFTITCYYIPANSCKRYQKDMSHKSWVKNL